MRQQYQAEQGRRIARRLEPLDLRDHASQRVVGHRPDPHDLSWCTAREPQQERSLRIRRLHATAAARDDQAGRDGAKRPDIEGCSRREAQGRDAQRGEIVVPQEQTEQMEQVGDAVVYRRRCDQQHARADDELGKRAVAVGVGVPEPVCFVDDEKAGSWRVVVGGGGRLAEGLMGHNRSLSIVLREQRSPLGNQHCRYDEREWLSQC